MDLTHGVYKDHIDKGDIPVCKEISSAITHDGLKPGPVVFNEGSLPKLEYICRDCGDVFSEPLSG